MSREENKLFWSLTKMCLLVLPLVLALPLFSYFMFGKFTFNIEKAMAFSQDKQLEDLDCEFGAYCEGSLGGVCGCNRHPCKTYNIQGYDCVREGHTGTGFLGMTDFHTEYWVCEGLGRVALSCVDYYNTYEEFEQELTQNSEGASK